MRSRPSVYRLGYFQRHLDYACWLRSRGVSCKDIAETFGISHTNVILKTNEYGAAHGYRFPGQGRRRDVADD